MQKTFAMMAFGTMMVAGAVLTGCGSTHSAIAPDANHIVTANSQNKTEFVKQFLSTYDRYATSADSFHYYSGEFADGTITMTQLESRLEAVIGTQKQASNDLQNVPVPDDPNYLKFDQAAIDHTHRVIATEENLLTDLKAKDVSAIDGDLQELITLSKETKQLSTDLENLN